jgi:RNA polymerase primary sigma factor
MLGENYSNKDGNGELLKRYLEDVLEHPVPTLEEEVDLTCRVRRGDREALKKLVIGNLRFVVFVASRFSYSRLPLIDLIQEGNIGLIKAAERFDPNKGVKFITYAVWWIRQSIQAALARKSGVVSLPLRRYQTVYRIKRKEEELSKLMERNPTVEEVAEALGSTPKRINVTLKAVCPALSLNDLVFDEPNPSYLDTLRADCRVDEGLLAEGLSKKIEQLMGVLKERERNILSMRFGLNGYEAMSLGEIGKIMDLTKERIRQLEKKALKRLEVVARSQGVEDLLH